MSEWVSDDYFYFSLVFEVGVPKGNDTESELGIYIN